MTEITFYENVDILETRYCHQKQLLINYGNLSCFSTDSVFKVSFCSLSNCTGTRHRKKSKLFKTQKV